MSALGSQLVEVVTKLIELTQDDKIKWSTSDAKDPGREDVKFGTIYKTEYLGKRLRMYKVSRKQDAPPAAAVIFGVNKAGPYWEASVNLEFVDDKNQPVWTFPYSQALADLLEAASCQSAGVYGFINDILSEVDKSKT